MSKKVGTSYKMAVSSINFILETSNKLQGERTDDIVLELFVNSDYFVRFDMDSKAKLQEILAYIESIDSDLWFSISEKMLSDKIRFLIEKLWIEKRKCKLADLEDYIKTLKDVPLSEYEVLAEIYGVQVESTPFKFYNFVVLKNNEASEYFYNKLTSFPQSSIDRALKPLTSENIIVCVVKARCVKRAYQIAEKLLNNLSLFMLYVSKKKSYYHMPTIYSRKKSHDRALCALSKSLISKDGNANILKELCISYELSDSVISEWEKEEARLLSMIQKHNHTEMENRIMKCLSWYRNAILEEVVERQVFNLCIAIESLLKPPASTSKPSALASYYAESLAFLLGDNYNDRIDIYKQFKDIYNVRSAVAHGEVGTTIGKYTLGNSFRLIRMIINLFLTQEPYNKITNFDDVFHEVNRIKFS